MSSSSFLTELFDPDPWPLWFFSPASGEARRWTVFTFIRLTSHGFQWLYGSYNTLLTQNLLFSDKSGQDNRVIMVVAWLIIAEFDLSGLIIVLLPRCYTFPTLHLWGFDIVRFHELQHMDTKALTDQQKLTCISSVRTLDAVKRTYQERWTIGMDSETEALIVCLGIMAYQPL